MKYTKGKWLKLRDGSVIAEGKENDGFIISDCFGPDADANSNLISSAPALLEALEGLMAIVNDSRGVAGFHLNGNTALWEEFSEIDAAYSAIKQARGE